MKKLVVRLDLEDDKAKRKAMKIVSTLQGIDSIAVDMKGKKMTVIGTVDPVRLVGKLRKYWQADIITIGPAKEPEKKKEEAKPAAAEEGKKGEGKEEGKKEEGKGKGDEKKKEEGKKEDGGGKKMEGGEKKNNAEPEPEWESESEWSSEEEEEEVVRKQPIPEHVLELIRRRQYNPNMGNYPPYMAMGMGMANPYMSNPQPHPQYQPQPQHQPSYYVQRVVEEDDNTNGCSIF